jgi:ubiquinone/menaquinone biosynthesis C-methylase UbiE
MMEKIKDIILGIDMKSFLKDLKVSNLETLEEATRYFAEKEALARSQILRGYFGERGINTIIETTAKELKVLQEGSNILDIGAGTGFFAIAIKRRLGKELNFYAMDATQAMLLAGFKDMERDRIVPFLGVAEQIKESIKLSNLYYERLKVKIPSIYQGVLSILTLHHCEDIDKVFESIHSVMDRGTSCIIIDLCEHPFTEFKEEMGDIHLGFNLDWIKEKAAKVFREVKVKRLPGIKCKESGRAAELFVALMKTL